MADFPKSATKSLRSEKAVYRRQIAGQKMRCSSYLGYASYGENIGRGKPKCEVTVSLFLFFDCS